MDNILFLFTSTPEWFFRATGDFSSGPLGALPTLGTIALLVGIILAFLRREWRLIAYLLSFFASQLLLVVGALSRGRMSQSEADIVLYAFLGFQAVLLAVLVWRFRGARLAAAALAVFSACYAIFASFVATNAMANSFL